MAKKKKPTVEEEVKTDAVTPEPEEQYDVPAEAEVTGSGDEPEYEDEDPEAVNADARQSAASSNSRLKEMMNQNFIEYASYVIKDRAIPDVDDGFKPVQRRILWAHFRGQITDRSHRKILLRFRLCPYVSPSQPSNMHTPKLPIHNHNLLPF